MCPHRVIITLATIIISSHSTSRTNSISKRRVPHAFHNGLAQLIHLLGVMGGKGSGNCGTIIHPALELELPQKLLLVLFAASLRYLVASYIWLVEIMHKVDGKLDEKVSLLLSMIWVVQPVIKVGMRPEPKHGMRSILDPVCLLPLLQQNGSKRNTRQNIAGLEHFLSLRQWCSILWRSIR